MLDFGFNLNYKMAVQGFARGAQSSSEKSKNNFPNYCTIKFHLHTLIFLIKLMHFFSLLILVEST